MAAKGYISVDDLAAFMGKEFTVAQEALANLVIEASEAWVDGYTKHAWLETSPATDVLYNPQTPYLWLVKSPIASVTSIEASNPSASCATSPLVEGQNFFVESLRDGRIYSPYTQRVYKVTVVYVPGSGDVPAEVQMAMLTLASSNMRMTPGMSGGVDPSIVQRYNVGGELEVEFRKSWMVGGMVVPQQVLSYLSGWVRDYVVV
jgi:hypothetical protein